MAERKTYRRWTDEEVEFLKNNIGILTIPNIAKRLGRTEKAIISKIEKLNLGSFKSNTDKITVADAAEILGVNYKTVRYYIDKGYLKAWRKCIRHNSYQYFLSIDEVEKFSENYHKQEKKPWTGADESRFKMYLEMGYTHSKIAVLMGRTLASIKKKSRTIYFK